MDPQPQPQPQLQAPTCPVCYFTLAPNFYFCPNCGKKIGDPPVSTSIGRQTWIYFLSFFLPPLGLWPGLKYIRQKDGKARQIGYVAIVLTVVSIVASVWFAMEFFNQVNSSLQRQMQQYQEVGL